MIQFNQQDAVAHLPVEMGVVLEVKDDVVRVQPHHHAACSNCGSSTICFPDSKPAPVVEASRKGTAEIKVGDLVELRRPEAPRIVASLLLFGLPVLMIVLGAIVGMDASGQQTQGGVAGALAGLMFGIILVRFINRFAKASTSLRPVVGPVIDQSTLQV